MIGKETLLLDADGLRFMEGRDSYEKDMEGKHPCSPETLLDPCLWPGLEL